MFSYHIHTCTHKPGKHTHTHTHTHTLSLSLQVKVFNIVTAVITAIVVTVSDVIIILYVHLL